jgi:DNA-binding NarL/FixJ family response regulator
LAKLRRNNVFSSNLPEPAEGQVVDLAAVWKHLVEGRATVTSQIFTQTRCGIVLTRRPDGKPPVRLEGRRLVVMESVLRGTCQNNVAIDLRIAASTVAFEARAGLAWLGVDSQPSRVHPLLMLMASTSAGGEGRVPARQEGLGHDETWSISIPRPELCLGARLPPAQREVVAQLVEGRSYAEIAAHRRTATRTIANQLAGAFRALHCSGRSELIHRLFVLSGWLPDSSARAA